MRLAVLLAFVTASCTRPRPAVPAGSHTQPARTESRSERVERARGRAAQFLLEQQAADGAWRSDVYGPFKDGDALTPLVLDALQPEHSPEASRGCGLGLDYLAGLARSNDPAAALNYPVYTAALAVVALDRSAPPEHRRARDVWLASLRSRQLTAALGWQPEDLAYGGWGFGEPPRRPPGGDAVAPFAQANISTTVLAVEALRATGAAPDDPALRAARTFLARCQNHGDPASDGGFYFSAEDVVRNKAGGSGEGFHSYGSATADGLRGLMACGLAGDNRRVLAARQWLARNFSAASHPGQYAADREPLRDAVYYYWCRSAAQALSDSGANRVDWAERLADALLARQRPDGSWSNPLVAQREDDPIVSTSFALRALSICSLGKP